MTVRAKFRCESVRKYFHGGTKEPHLAEEIELVAVYGDDITPVEASS